MSMWSYLGAYMLGGLTLLPGVVLIGYLLAPQAEQQLLEPDNREAEEEQYTDQFLGPIIASTYFYLSPSFVNLGEPDDDFPTPKVKARQQLKNSLDPASPKKTSLAKIPKYFGTVRGAVLQIWADDTCAKLISTVKLSDYLVTLWPQGAEDFELFYKKFPIVLISKTTSDGLVSLDMFPNHPPPNSQYIYVDNPSAKEDLYFALIAGTRQQNDTTSMGPRDPKVMAKPIDLDQEDIHELLNRVYSSNEGPQTQWINALLGRLFLAVKFSRQLDEYIKHKIVYKLSKVKPSFIGEIEVQNVKVGSSLPYFNEINLKSFAVDGNMTVEGNIVYSGGFSLDVLFTCYIKVPGLARREFRCILAVKLQSLQGTLVVRVKPPPSSHLWYAFKEMPKMDLKIEPTVANRQLSYSLITNALSSMISDAVKESMVLPYMDDIPFCETSDEFYRGGIWDASQRPSNVPWTQEKREKQRSNSFDAGHEVIFKDDSSSITSSKSTRSISTAAAEDNESAQSSEAATPKPISKFWNNLLRRKTSSTDIGMGEAISSESTATTTGATSSKNYGSLGGLAPVPDTVRRQASSGTSTTAVTPASVYGVQPKMYIPPETFATRKPVPATVTAANANFDPVKQPREYSTLDPNAQGAQTLGVPRKPVGSSDDTNRTLRASRSLQQLNRVVSRSTQNGNQSPASLVSGQRGGHSPTSSISSRVSTTSKMSNASYRRVVRLENLNPEPEAENPNI